MLRQCRLLGLANPLVRFQGWPAHELEGWLPLSGGWSRLFVSVVGRMNRPMGSLFCRARALSFRCQNGKSRNDVMGRGSSIIAHLPQMLRMRLSATAVYTTVFAI